VAERLAEIGALDGVSGSAPRRDLLVGLGELHRRGRAAQSQLALVADPDAGLPRMTDQETLGAEVRTLGIDVSRHLMEHHHEVLRDLGATDSKHLADVAQGRSVLVAGVRASTQTPPIASGKRVIFVTLDDGSGLVDLAFFEDSHEACAHTVFHSGLLLVRGTVQRRGPRPTVVGVRCWDLEALATARRDQGLDALQKLIASPTEPARPAPGPQQVVPMPNGTHLHRWADLQPAGTRSADLKALGYTSPGSAG
jgi:error-prone DNA polymerase